MGLKEEVEEIKEDVNKVSFAYELLKDYKKQNKRLFILLIVTLTMWFATIGAFLYYINTTSYEENTEYAEVDNENGDANACVGDNCSNGDVIYGEGEGLQEN